MLPQDIRPGILGASGETERKYNPFLGKDFISVDQIRSRKDIEFLFRVTDKMKDRVEQRIQGSELKDQTVVILFYQPSTRTFTSFYSAARWLGCERVMGIQGMLEYSSAVKGESLPDTIRSIEATTAADIIILRHPEDNSSELAARYATKPVVNAGSGTLEHPTQATLDLYTIREETGRVDDLTVTMVGDLLYGRTVKSLAKLLAIVDRDVRINLVSPQILGMPYELTTLLQRSGVKIYETENLEEVLDNTDVLYVTRVQKEWFEKTGKMGLYDEIKNRYIVTERIVKMGKPGMVVMHPLPRVNEIDPGVDTLPQAAYFRQMRNGLYTRMALLAAIAGKV